MKAKTKIQIEIADLMVKLPEISEKQMQFSQEKCMSNWMVHSRKTFYCLDCGHSWKGEQYLGTSIVGEDCPVCGKLLKLAKSYNGNFSERSYFSILTTIKNFQVIRIFMVEKNCKKLHRATFSHQEVIQHWIREDGKSEFLSKNVQGMSMYYDQWAHGSEISFHNYRGGYSSTSRFQIEGDIFPSKRILPSLKRNGFKGSFYGIRPQELFPYLLGNNKAETLLKAGQISLFKHGVSHADSIQKYWTSIRIAMRKGYIVKDASMWIDTLELLEYFGKDLHNAHYVCPENIKVLHNDLMNKKKAILDREAYEKKKAKAEKEQKAYAEAMGKFFDLLFADSEITIAPLRSVEEFIKEGETLHHCVYTNEYYKKHDSLILSARIDQKPVETIQINLKNMTITQSRGLQNQPTAYHEKIINLVNQNLPLIQQLAS